MCGKYTCLISKNFFNYKLENTNLIINIINNKEVIMGKGTIKTKAMTMAVAMSMVAGLCPSAYGYLPL